jgi:hypothetical protein
MLKNKSNMKKQTTKNLVLSLIKDDLIHTKLVNGLDNLNLNANVYLLSIPEIIFVLLKIKSTKKGEKLFEYYLDLKEKVQTIDIKTSHDEVEKLSNEIYKELMSKK